jgi:hypothetical protein
LLRATEPEDIMAGDFVTHGGLGPVGVVESVDGDCATVSWDKGRRDILPLATLRRAPQRGSIFDSRHGQ